ncbi:MAG: GNAT family N-acetyltransferase [Chthoniobacterales bacterium]
MREVLVELMKPEDWPAVREIYRAGLDTGQASFETDVPDWEKWDAKYLAPFRLVARDDNGNVVGWAGLTRVSERRVYVGVAEVSIYVSAESRRHGIGAQLMRALLDVSERGGIWTLQSTVFPENTASIRLHLKCGFREVGRRERLGKHHGTWRDALLLERRSKVAGVD